MSPLIARHGSGAAGAAKQPNDLAVAIVAITYWSWAPAVGASLSAVAEAVCGHTEGFVVLISRLGSKSATLARHEVLVAPRQDPLSKATQPQRMRFR
jgi:hypothetical protein